MFNKCWIHKLKYTELEELTNITSLCSQNIIVGIAELDKKMFVFFRCMEEYADNTFHFWNITEICNKDIVADMLKTYHYSALFNKCAPLYSAFVVNDYSNPTEKIVLFSDNRLVKNNTNSWKSSTKDCLKLLQNDTDHASTSLSHIVNTVLGGTAITTTIVPTVVGISGNATPAITSTVIPVIGITANTTEVVGATTAIAEVVGNATTTGVVSTISSIPLWGVIGGILTAAGVIGGVGYLGYRLYSSCKEKQYYASVNQNEAVDNNMELQTIVVNTEVNLPNLDNQQHKENTKQKISTRFSKFELVNLKDIQEEHSSIQSQPTCSNQNKSIQVGNNRQDVKSALCEKLLHGMLAIGESGHSQVDNNTVYNHSNSDIKDMSGNLEKSTLPSSHDDIIYAHQLCQELAHNMSVIGES